MAFRYRDTEESAKVGRLDRKVGATPGTKKRKRNLKGCTKQTYRLSIWFKTGCFVREVL